MNSEINELIIKIAAEDVKLLQLISSLPEINCVNFNFHDWISKVKNIHPYIEKHKSATNVFINSSYVQRVHFSGSKKWRIILNNTYNFPVDRDSYTNEFMSGLIKACKKEKIKLLLNFV